MGKSIFKSAKLRKRPKPIQKISLLWSVIWVLGLTYTIKIVNDNVRQRYFSHVEHF